MYSRADRWRNVAVVALFLTATSTSAAAREYRAADTRDGDYPTVRSLRYMARLIDVNRTNMVLIGTFVPVMIVSAFLFRSIERIRKVE